MLDNFILIPYCSKVCENDKKLRLISEAYVFHNCGTTLYAPL